MSWSRRTRPIALAGILVAAAALLGGCSFSPVYSGALAGQTQLNLAYAKPTSRLEQIIYQDLALRLGRSEAETAPLVTVSAAASGGSLGFLTATANPSKPNRVTVTATATITARDGSKAEPLVIARRATAEYTTNSQVLADTAASTEAGERAAKAAAESLRLAILAALSGG
jgi:hypothetical protein